jgi:hypothetical protein
MRHIVRRAGRFHLLASALPITLVFAAGKAAAHYFGLELIPRELASFFPTVLTSIIFVLGFLLAGVVADYKESEKLPAEIAASLSVIYQELRLIRDSSGSAEAAAVLERAVRLARAVYEDFFLRGERGVLAGLIELNRAVASLEKISAAVYVNRIKLEISGLRKSLNRIVVIKDTDFVPSVFATVKIIAGVFLTLSLGLRFDPWWGSLILTTFFSFMIFTIMFLIKDMEDPFEYETDGGAGGDEVSLAVIEQVLAEMEAV